MAAKWCGTVCRTDHRNTFSPMSLQPPLSTASRHTPAASPSSSLDVSTQSTSTYKGVHLCRNHGNKMRVFVRLSDSLAHHLVGLVQLDWIIGPSSRRTPHHEFAAGLMISKAGLQGISSLGSCRRRGSSLGIWTLLSDLPILKMLNLLRHSCGESGISQVHEEPILVYRFQTAIPSTSTNQSFETKFSLLLHFLACGWLLFDAPRLTSRIPLDQPPPIVPSRLCLKLHP